MFSLPYFIQRPARYIGIEPLSIKKDLKNIEVHFGLCFPDIYEVGMSYYGHFLLYELLNGLDFVFCERIYAPWKDMEEYLRKNQIPLFTLETKTPLYKLDILGFSLTYELNLTNVLNILELSFIPKRWKDRTFSPLVIAGGPLTVNPKPFEAFFDLIVIGEAEEILPELVRKFKELKGEKREEVLKELGNLKGVYIPSFKKRTVERVYIKDLDSAIHSTKPPIPLSGSIHNRLNIEISRGCGNGCRFCLAGYIYRPYRERSFETLKGIIEEGLRRTGYEEISFLSLSSGDHSDLPLLLSHVRKTYPGITLSLPSLRIGSLKGEDLSCLGEISRTGLTFALETPSQRLREKINKRIDLESFIGLIPTLKRYGWRRIKVYLMIGLPFEEEKDLAEIKEVLLPFEKAGLEITLSISSFVPKPFTPFQWVGMRRKEDLLERFAFLKEKAKSPLVKIKISSIERSMIEAIIGRGDENLSEILEEVHKSGARLEGWTEFFKPELYFQALEKRGLEIERYLGDLPFDLPLPWDFVDVGIRREFLKEEFERARKGLKTEACYNFCVNCGLACKEKKKKEEITLSFEEKREPFHSQKKILIRYKKVKEARYLGHLDTISIILRALRIEGVKFAMHGKFHPLPKVSFSDAIPLFVESNLEFMEASVENFPEKDGLLRRINAFLPNGLKLLEIKEGEPEREEVAFLLITKEKLDKTPVFIRKDRYFYVVEKKELKEVLKSLSFERIIKIKKRRIEKRLPL